MATTKTEKTTRGRLPKYKEAMIALPMRLPVGVCSALGKMAAQATREARRTDKKAKEITVSEVARAILIREVKQ